MTVARNIMVLGAIKKRRLAMFIDFDHIEQPNIISGSNRTYEERSTIKIVLYWLVNIAKN